MRRALEEDQYSAFGSIVDTDSDSDDGLAGPGPGGAGAVEYRGSLVRLDRAAIHQYATQYMAALSARSGGRATGGGPGAAASGAGANPARPAPGIPAAGGVPPGPLLPAARDGPWGAGGKDAAASARSTPVPAVLGSSSGGGAAAAGAAAASSSSAMDAMTRELEEEWDLEGGSIFGQTTGASNFTWYACLFGGGR
jgi:hypothetical protein